MIIIPYLTVSALEDNLPFLPRSLYYVLLVMLLKDFKIFNYFSLALDVCASDIVPLIEEYFSDRNVCSFFFLSSALT